MRARDRGPWHVYSLNDPRTSRPFYIGMSIHPRKRLAQHRGYDSSARWEIKELKRLGLSCELVILSSHDKQDEARLAEFLAIESTPDLVNRDRSDPRHPDFHPPRPRLRGAWHLYG